MYEVKVSGVVREPLTSRYIMLLEAKNSDHQDVVIPVGKFEAENICCVKSGSDSKKRSPFDILSPILNWVDSVVFDKLVIDDCECGIFTAKLYMNIAGQDQVLDCRPSDGVYLAIDRSIPVFVSKVLTCPDFT